jgi:ABC-type polysaccharide/polyol phosphate export permease
LGDWNASLLSAGRGIAQEPHNVDLLMRHGSVLGLLARYAEAARDFRVVLSLVPQHLDASKALFAVLTENGDYTDATMVGGQLIANDPTNHQIGSALHFVLRRRFVDGANGRASTLTRSLPPEKAKNSSVPAPKSWKEAADGQFRVLVALIRREMRTRFGRTRLGYAWALLEPSIHVAILTLVIGVTIKGVAPLGHNYSLLYFTGVMPYQLFVHTSSQVASGVLANRPLLQIPLVSSLDVMCSRALLELITQVTVGVLIYSLFFAAEIANLPDDLLTVVAAVIFLWLFATGIGIINALITSVVHAWERLWTATLAILYFTSGVFYLPMQMPIWIRDILKYNPLLQAIEMFRSGFFENYSPYWQDSIYLGVVALGTIVLALLFERTFRRQLLEHY